MRQVMSELQLGDLGSPSYQFTRMRLSNSDSENGSGIRNKQPKALEDGNWVCDDPTCVNVNYPRRTECNKCGKKRGPLGDAVVRAYVENMRLIRGESSGGFSTEGYGGNGLEINNFSFQPAGNGGQRGTLRNHQGDSWMGFIRGNHILDSEPWGGAFGGPHVQREFSFPGSQVGVNGGNGHFQPRNKFMSVQLEGKKLAEQLMATFSTSIDPLGEAGECLASAALWLQVLRPRAETQSAVNFLETSGSYQNQGDSQVTGNGLRGLENHSLSYGQNSPGIGANLPFSERGNTWGFGSPLSPVGSAIGLQNLGSSEGGNQGNQAMTSSGFGGVQSFLGASRSGGRLVVQKPNVRFEDYKDRPSDYLREFGDPAAVNASAVGPNSNVRPEPEVNGNWECEDCKNVNFPRRTYCFQCQKKRGPKGEEVVREYVRRLIEG